ncbi:FprA family A-type flavoprotein [Gemmiger sp.]|uniref:FprA family A-type flavoprotein n=1 Tax=Gemmiger sp. TaxID=2049027 RepID=UPI003F01E12E
MQNIQSIADGIFYVGASDRRLAKFENLFPIPRGVSYNSYVIVDDKTALMDTADAAVGGQFLENMAAALDGRGLDYLVIDHMEPDHAAMIEAVLLRWPGAQLVCNAKAVPMLRMYFPGKDAAIASALVVKEGDSLCLGRHTLHFVMAPMVHWPEVMMSFESATGTLFSADAFGTFGALDGAIFADEVAFPTRWLDDARRYYANIVGKYGVQVQGVLKKADGLPIRTIAPLHGPIWRQDLEWFIGKYDLWSRCEPEEKAVTVLYGSMYGNTASAANALAARIAAQGVKVAVHDLSCVDTSEAVAECWRAAVIVLAAPTYNGGIYLPAGELLDDLKALGLHDRVFALVENGSWAPMSGKLMAAKIGELKNCTVLDQKVTVRGRLTAAQDAELDACARAVAAAL